jgi:hypothetical protein
MPNNVAELLIRIGADPSNAESNIQRLRQAFARELTGMSQAARPLNTNLSAVNQTVQNLASRFNVGIGAVNTALNRNQQIAQFWKTQMVANLAEVLNASELLNASLVRSFMLFDTALGVNIASAVIWQRSIGEAFRKAALSAISSIAQEALVRAIYSTALGFYLLAVQDYRGAALAFKSAATFGVVGGAAALAGRALAGPDVSEAAQGATARRPGEVAPSWIVSGKQETPESQAAQKTVQVIFQGPVYGGQAGIDELVRHISQAVTERDVNLVAYTVVRQPVIKA